MSGCSDYLDTAPTSSSTFSCDDGGIFFFFGEFFASSLSVHRRRRRRRRREEGISLPSSQGGKGVGEIVSAPRKKPTCAIFETNSAWMYRQIKKIKLCKLHFDKK